MRRHKLNGLRKFETLEDRRMKAGDIDFDNGILTVNGAGFNDVAEIRFEGDQVNVDLYAGNSDGDTDHHDRDEDIADVTRIIFNGFAGSDTVNVVVDGLDSGIILDTDIAFEFHGGDNNDTLTQTGGGIFTVADGDAGNDNLGGSQFNDILEGGANDDIMDGGAGSDVYVFAGSNLGTDEVREAANVDNHDTLSFYNFSQSVGINLATAYTSANPAYAFNSTDLRLKLSTSTGIEDVDGTKFDDVIIGNARDNHLNGYDGLDRLEGKAGDDTLAGGSESDTYFFLGNNLGTDSIIENANSDNDVLSFTGMNRGLGIDLSKAGPSNYAVNSTDLKLKLSNDTAIETVYGTDYDDKILGNSRDNFLYGRGGTDGLQGMAGVDELHGGADSDILYADVLDHAYGEGGWDYFSGIKETTNRLANPRPFNYIDWSLI